MTDTALERGVSVAGTLLGAAEFPLQREHVRFFTIRYDDLSRADQEQLRRDNLFAVLVTCTTEGFLRLASIGHPLVPEAEIQSVFGRSLRANYPEANETFLNFATTYWTLKIVSDALVENNRETLVQEVLTKVEQTIATVFFPLPGPVKMPVATREQMQRKFLAACPSARYNIDEFMTGNPIIIRDRRAEGLGVPVARSSAPPPSTPPPSTSAEPPKSPVDATPRQGDIMVLADGSECTFHHMAFGQLCLLVPPTGDVMRITPVGTLELTDETRGTARVYRQRTGHGPTRA